eukprot:CAMPEP_0173098394 /NCGR_PEP_ID=MMETSP1102-20130122/34705_1 /TAXON_ID=49646 /ORGANISM="Geminigera sp., Strain Caron Lab Isolate" /LENGTH=230 /DNA_ID=CAMNT_0013990883 /DNA_START=220 /DNA_END=913 /DNA_ORIENTATION=+
MRHKRKKRKQFSPQHLPIQVSNPGIHRATYPTPDDTVSAELAAQTNIQRQEASLQLASTPSNSTRPTLSSCGRAQPPPPIQVSNPAYLGKHGLSLSDVSSNGPGPDLDAKVVVIRASERTFVILLGTRAAEFLEDLDDGSVVLRVAFLVLGIRIRGESASLLAVLVTGRGSLGSNNHGDTSRKSSAGHGVTASKALGHHSNARAGLSLAEGQRWAGREGSSGGKDSSERD